MTGHGKGGKGLGKGGAKRHRRHPRQQKSLALEVAEKAFQEMAWTDFSVVFEGEEVRCHRFVLAGVSPVFAAMMRNEHQEAAEARAVIQLPAVIGKAFIRFMYLEEVEEGLLEQEVVAFLELGEKYQVEKLKELAEVTMVRSLKKENLIEFFQAADMFRAPRAKAAAMELARANRAWLRGEGREGLGRLTRDQLIQLLL